MKNKLTAAFAAIVFGALVSSCANSPIQIAALETKYGTLVTNADGSQSFTTKPSSEAPTVVGTIVTEQGKIIANPNGSFTFKSKSPTEVAAIIATAEAPQAVVVEPTTK